MSKQILFIQGGGGNGYETDKALAHSLQTTLGNNYQVNYPEIKPDESKPDYGWIRQLQQQIINAANNVIIVAHSFGASMLLKYLSEHSINKKIAAIFLFATPFWDGKEDWQKAFLLQNNFADKLPRNMPVFFYHSADDDEVPLTHFIKYKQKLPMATFHKINIGGHQFNNNLEIVANDIKTL